MKRLAWSAILAFFIMWAAFVSYTLWGDHYEKVLPAVLLEPDEVSWQMLSGSGARSADDWAVVETGVRGYSRIGIALPWPVAAENFQRIEVYFGQAMLDRPVRVGWSESSSISAHQNIAVEMVSERVGVIETSWLRSAGRKIRFVTLEIFGGASEPLLIDKVRLVPDRPDFLQLHRRLVSEWFAFPPWSQRDTNYRSASLQPTMVSPLLAVAFWAFLTALMASLMGRVSPRHFLSSLLVCCCLGWLALDLRWQVDLFAKSVDTVESYGWKTWQERRVADTDGDLFDFIQELKQLLGDRDRRVFALGYGDYWRLRARYHALPWSTRSTERPLSHSWVRHLESSDLLLLLDTPYIDEVTRNFKIGKETRLEKEFELKEAVGRGATLVSRKGQNILETEASKAELVRLKIGDLPGRAFYQINARLRSTGELGAARFVVRWQDDQGQTVNATNRLFEVSSENFAEYSTVFVLPSHRDVAVFIVDETGQGLQADAIRIDPLEEDNLLWLQSNEQGPYLVVRPIVVDRLNRAYEVL